MRRSSQAVGSCMHVVICMVVCGTIGELIKLWLMDLVYVSGTSDDRGKAKA